MLKGEVLRQDRGLPLRRTDSVLKSKLSLWQSKEMTKHRENPESGTDAKEE